MVGRVANHTRILASLDSQVNERRNNPYCTCNLCEGTNHSSIHRTKSNRFMVPHGAYRIISSSAVLRKLLGRSSYIWELASSQSPCAIKLAKFPVKRAKR